MYVASKQDPLKTSLLSRHMPLLAMIRRHQQERDSENGICVFNIRRGPSALVEKLVSCAGKSLVNMVKDSLKSTFYRLEE